MKTAFQEIGQVCVTMAHTGEVLDKPCKLTGSGTVAPSGSGEGFCGVAVSQRGGYAGVVMRGFVTLPCSGTVPGVGKTSLLADGSGGVRAPATGETGESYLIVAVDGKNVTILL